MFKIYNPIRNEYSAGRMTYGYSKKGKVWSSLGHLKSHLTSLFGCYPLHIWKDGNYPYKDCVIREYSDTGMIEYSIKPLIIESIDKHIAKNQGSYPSRVEKRDSLLKLKEIVNA